MRAGAPSAVLVAAVEALTFQGIQVQAFRFDPEAGEGTGYFVTDRPSEAKAALANAGLPADIVVRELDVSCRAPRGEDATSPAP